MRKLTNFLSIIMVIVMAMTVILPTIVTAVETETTNMNDTEVVINIYEGRSTNSFSDIENKCMLYLFDMYRITMRNSDGAYIYCDTQGNALFATLQDARDENNRIVTIAPGVTSEKNIVVEPDKDFFISIQDFGASENVPKKITLNFTEPPKGQEVTITITDGIDAAKMSNEEMACMIYLFEAGIIAEREDECTMYNTRNNKDLMYSEDKESSIIRIADGVTSADNLEVDVDATNEMITMFIYFGVEEIPTKIKLQFQVENDLLKGDLDGNNVVDANDASVALELYKAQNATAEDIAIGDMDNNNLIDANDASLILEYFKTHQ